MREIILSQLDIDDLLYCIGRIERINVHVPPKVVYVRTQKATIETIKIKTIERKEIIHSFHSQTLLLLLFSFFSIRV